MNLQLWLGVMVLVVGLGWLLWRATRWSTVQILLLALAGNVVTLVACCMICIVQSQRQRQRQESQVALTPNDQGERLRPEAPARHKEKGSSNE